MSAITELRISPFKFLFVFSLLLAVAGCSKERTVNGQVFIVTRDAQNIKLGLVEVLLIDEASAKEWAAKSQADVEIQTSFLNNAVAKAQAECEAAKKSYDDFLKTNAASIKVFLEMKEFDQKNQKELTVLVAERKKILSELPDSDSRKPYLLESKNAEETLTNLVYTLKNLPSLRMSDDEEKTVKEINRKLIQNCLRDAQFRPAYEEIHSVVQKAESDNESTNAAMKKPLDASQISLENARSKLNAFPAVEDIFANFAPAVSAKTVTDADGKFALTFPRKGRFAVFCRASRQVGSTQERYSWFSWLPQQDIPNPFLLSNNNLVTQNRSDSVLSVTPK